MKKSEGLIFLHAQQLRALLYHRQRVVKPLCFVRTLKNQPIELVDEDMPKVQKGFLDLLAELLALEWVKEKVMKCNEEDKYEPRD